ncbi:hypothetical protein [Sporosarcina sp. G11-34]|uniref:hypothetical protein n=1 Tax=Sporosarcina sp. G11-34 TaxID=2849605 RepID=UPI0022A956CF|nr:hypothetical protein [Sporosarcina sp. G11-34]MCZ2260348.1 hypothetical protein [Sporosarcina sp. G11-34]
MYEILENLGGENDSTISLVKGAPGHYRIGKGVLDEIELLLSELGIQKVHIVSGEKGWNAVQP